ncbi:MAG: phosphatase PAP2 family protein [Candidatus Thorarchaeota archaeon]
MKKQHIISIVMIVLGFALIATALGIVYASYPPNRANNIDNTIATFFQNNSSSTIETILKYVTYLGEPIVFVGLLLILYYAWDKRKGYRAITVVVSSTAVVYSAKAGFRMERPASSIWGGGIEAEDITTYGFPSGHAQVGTTFWGMLGIFVTKWGMLIFAILIPLILGFSRIYLRVHWFTDVIMGLGIGLIILVVYMYAEEPITNHLETRSNVIKVLYALLTMVVLAAPVILLHYDPVFLSYDIDGEIFKRMISTLKFIILFTTVSISYTFEEKIVNFENKKEKWWHILLRILIGIIVIALIYGYNMIFDYVSVNYIISAIVDLIVYALLGPFIILFIPWLIKKLKI